MLRLAAALLVAAATLPAQDDLDRQMKSVIDAYALVEQNAADPVSSEQAFYQGAIPGLLRRLDPHSVFFDPGQFEQLKKMEASTQKGFGSVVSLLPGRVIVLQTMPGTPSAKAGLAPGDEILAINGYVISRLDLDQLTELLSQSRQQQAQLDVRRPGTNGLMRLVLTPEEMQAPSVERAFFLAPASATSEFPASMEAPAPRSRRPSKSWAATVLRAWCWIFATIPAACSPRRSRPRRCFSSPA